MVRFESVGHFGSLSAVFIVIFALPSYVSLVRYMGVRRGLIILLVFSVLPLLVEALAIWTGFPYGEFHYSELLGYTVLGLVPISVSFAYTPILLGAMSVASRFSGRSLAKYALFSSLVNVSIDLVIDPAAVSAGFWGWTQPGAYYGVPLINFLGWIMTGSIYAALFYLMTGVETNLPLPSSVSTSLIWILCFWTGYNLLKLLFLPGILGVAEVFFLLRTYE
ncbi:carotenoid biosynthesis protein [Candidatus Bathyarchaeota archaeon]|nr:carotenoid biosynthesis protein [Candidatus Bathyarchaeota archaeon]